MITFFVSSTFRDMHGERTLLHSRVLPRIREYARHKGEFVDICDLRWGVDLGSDGDESMLTRLLDTCLDTLDDCHGYMICFLGESYGTQLQEEEAAIFEQVWTRRRARNLESYAISLTQVELEYGLLDADAYYGPARDRCLCFRRTCADLPVDLCGSADQRMLQEELVTRVSSTKGLCCKEYTAGWDADQRMTTDLDGLDVLLYNDMKRIVDELAKARENKNWADLELDEALAHAEELNKGFAGRIKELEMLRTYSRDGSVAVYGESGIGKSAFLANWLSSCPCQHRWYVACGNGDHSKTVLDVAIQLLYFTDQLLQGGSAAPRQNLSFESQAIDVLIRQLKSCDEHLERVGEEALIVLDAVNQLRSVDRQDCWASLGSLKLHHIKLVVSAIEPLHGFDKSIELNRLKVEEVEDIFSSNMYLVNAEARKTILEPITAKKEYDKPLYLRAAIDILKMHLSDRQEGDTNVFERYQTIIATLSNTVDGLMQDVFDHAFTYLSTGFGPSETMREEYDDYLGLIARSAYGIADADVVELLGVDANSASVAFVAQIRLFLRSFFRRDWEGRWTFSHDLVYTSMRQAAGERPIDEMLCAYGRHRTLPSTVGQGETGRASLDMTAAQQTLLFYDVIRAAFVQQDYDLLGQGLLRSANELEAAEYGAYQGKDPRNSYTTTWGLIARSINQALDEGDAMHRRYEQLMRSYPNQLEPMLTGALTPVNNRMDANRRISAMRPAVLFAQESMGMLADRRIDLDFCWFLKQLIDIHDDTSVQEEALDYIELSSGFIKDEHLSDYLACGDEESAFRLVASANLDYFCANKLIKDGFDKARDTTPDLSFEAWEPDESVHQRAMRVSDEMYGWYQREIEERVQDGGASLANLDLLERCLAFTNNIGQHLNAMQQVDRGYPYRMKSLDIKVSALLRQLGLEEALARYHALCEAAEGWSTERHLEIAERHAAFWGQLESCIKDTDACNDRGLTGLWQSFATTYRSLGTDYYYREGELWQWSGCVYLQLAVALMRDYGFVVNNKEVAVTSIRLAGMWAKRLEACPAPKQHDADALMVAFGEATEAFERYASFDAKEKENLLDNIKCAQKTFGRIGTPAQQADLAHYRERVESI